MKPEPPIHRKPDTPSLCLSLVVVVQHSIMSNSLWHHKLQHTRLPCPPLSPGVCSQSCPLSQWCHPTISSSVTPISSCLQSFPASRSFPLSQLFASGSQSVAVGQTLRHLCDNFKNSNLAKSFRRRGERVWCWKNIWRNMAQNFPNLAKTYKFKMLSEPQPRWRTKEINSCSGNQSVKN